MIPFVDLKKQYLSIKAEIDVAISKVFDRSWFILGEQVEAFEKEFADYCGIGYGIGVGSGTEALHLALLAVGLRLGDEVITVANTAVPTVAAIESAGGRPVFVDIETDTYTIDVTKIESAITDKTTVILPVHLYGHPADMGVILQLGAKYDLKIVEDCAQAHGALYQGKKVGTIGHLGCFSFYPSKNLGAYGDGGMVITSDGELAERVRLLRNYGQTKRYQHELRGFNSRLDEIQAAILRVKLKELNSWNERRRAKADLYGQLIDKKTFVLPKERADCRHVYHLYVIRSKNRDQLRQYLKEHGINTEIHYPIPINQQKAYADLACPLPMTELCMSQILSLPMYPELEDESIELVANALNKYK